MSPVAPDFRAPKSRATTIPPRRRVTIKPQNHPHQAAPTHLARAQTFIATDKGDEIDDGPVYRDRPEISSVRRIWLNGDLAYDVRTNRDKPIGAKLPIELFLGGDSQTPPEIMEAEEGVDAVPGYRGLAYLLFEALDLTSYGNHLPNVSAEVIASLDRIVAEEGVEGLAQGLDGDLWICCHTRRVVVRADPVSLRVKATIARANPSSYLGDLPAHPWRIAVSPTTGLVWVVCLADRALAVIDPATNAVAAIVDLAENYPHEIAIGADGVPWLSFPLQNKVCTSILSPMRRATLRSPAHRTGSCASAMSFGRAATPISRCSISPP